ncbi:BAAT/acyl-CoA thioester hydrolase carboxy-terminal protein [Senna tora]|uniref:BAAT/acyl-CoA thioester hydrolase carboxy-terminal protein n=1 Tax=Senna tora TaxID=362788 RepID=A0A834WHP0_9FABA|nr:BAAT/acyl-CoA thioester hydrolase carboxy-terminal protein [Senna tora]
MSRPSESGDERVHNPGSQKRRVIIQNYHGEKLVGILHDARSTQLVIVCHGLQSSKERIPMVNLAAALEKDGISAFRFDFAGNGESEGSFRYGNYYREADDLRAVVQHFRDEKYVITAIIGHSKGGNVVLLYASKYKDVNVVVNISGRFNLVRGIEDRLGKNFMQRIKRDGFIDVKNRRGNIMYRVTEESLMDRLSTITHTCCLLIPQDCRVLTVHGSKDQTVPTEDALDFAKFIICNHEVRIVEGADHEYTCHQDDLVRIVLEFIKAHNHKHTFAYKQSPLGRVDKPPHSRL